MIPVFWIDGVGRTIQAMQKMKNHDGRNLATGIDSCLDVILKKARTYVPYFTGALYATGRKEFQPGVGLNVKGTVEFGGPMAPYAFVVHERPAYHAPPTRAFYLSAAVNDTRGTCVSILRRQMKVTLK
jgi:hypothetical protein